MRSLIYLSSAIVLPAILMAGCSKQTPDTNVAETSNAVVASNTSSAATPTYEVFREEKGEPAPTAEFAGPGGAKLTLAKFAGKPFILALWGTGFEESVRQLSSLDTLAAEGKISVVALNLDAGPANGLPDIVTPFLAAHHFKALADYRDTGVKFPAALRGPTVPNTYLYDSQGHQVLRLIGPVDFNSPAVRALLSEAK